MTMRFALAVIAVLAPAQDALAADLGTAELQKCRICHALDKGGPNRVGPDLFGVFGRKAGSVTGFSYSDAMKNSGIVWDDNSLAKFLRDPKADLPGNRMSFPGVADEATLGDLIRQLRHATQ